MSQTLGNARKSAPIKTRDIQSRYEYLLEMYNSTNDKSTKANLAHDLNLLEDEARILGITLREQTIKIMGVEPCTKPSFWRAVKHLFCKDDTDR